MKKNDITGRDDYILMEALIYAIEAIDRLPPKWQQGSDQDDMKTLLAHMFKPGFTLNHVTEQVRLHLDQGFKSPPKYPPHVPWPPEEGR